VVDGIDPLGEALFEDRPFLGGDYPWKEVHGPGPFDSLGFAVDGEGDAPAQEQVVSQRRVVAQVVGREGVEPTNQAVLAGSGRTVLADGFIEETAPVVAIQESAGHALKVVQMPRVGL